MAKPRYVQIEKDGQVAEVMPASVDAWERNGWTLVDDESSEVQPNQTVETPPTVTLVTESPATQTENEE